MVAKVLTDKQPFYQYKEIQMFSVLRRKETPHLPDEGDGRNVWGYGGNDDLMWDLLTKCWSYVPSRRPSCRMIQDALKEIGFQDDRPKATEIETGSSFWQAMREGSGSKADYGRVEEILRSVSSGLSFCLFGERSSFCIFRSIHSRLLRLYPTLFVLGHFVLVYIILLDRG